MGQIMPLWLFMILLITRSCGAFCPSSCHCNDRVLESSCVSSRLDTVPILLNPALQTLRLSHNRISSLQQSFTFYSELRWLDLSHNILHGLGSRHFESLQNLEFLNVSQNIITNIEMDSFAGLRSLKSLDLSGNWLSLLQSFLFSELSSLHTLILSDNKIQTIHEESFWGLQHLHTLLLDGNELHHVPSASFKGVPDLSRLSLGRNAIDFLLDWAFANLSRLEVLEMNDNALRHIDPEAFHNLRSLEVLDISFNRLHSVPLGALSSSLSALKHLDLSGNMWRLLPANLLQGMHSLETLNVSYMEYLRAVDVDAFQSNGSSFSLQQLIMTNNALWSYMPPQLLDNLNQLRKLDLSGNAFETMPATPLINNGKLEFLNLAYNPLQCNCSLFWLWKLLEPRHNGTLVAANVTCSGPELLSGIPLVALAHDDLQCGSSQLLLVIILSLFIGLVALTMLALLALSCSRQRSKRQSAKSSGTSPILTKNGSPNSVVHYYQTAIGDGYTYHYSQNTKRVPINVV